MVHSIDMKSALIGGFIVALILCFVGAVPFASPEYFGRFEIETNDNYAFILDSATGQAWSEMFLDPQMFLDPHSSLVVVPDPNFYAPKTHPPITTGS